VWLIQWYMCGNKRSLCCYLMFTIAALTESNIKPQTLLHSNNIPPCRNSCWLLNTKIYTSLNQFEATCLLNLVKKGTMKWEVTSGPSLLCGTPSHHSRFKPAYINGSEIVLLSWTRESSHPSKVPSMEVNVPWRPPLPHPLWHYLDHRWLHVFPAVSVQL